MEIIRRQISIRCCLCLLPVLLLMTTAWANNDVNETLYFPVVSHMSISEDLHFTTAFSFVNLTNTTAEGFLEVLDSEGGLPEDLLLPCQTGIVPPPSTGTPVDIPPVSDLIVTMEEMDINGWGRTDFEENGQVHAAAEIALIRGERFRCDPLWHHSSDEVLDTVRVPAVSAARIGRLDVTVTEVRRTALSLVNPSPSETAHVEIALRRPGGMADSSATIEVPPLNRVSKFLLEIVVPEGLTSEGPVPGKSPDGFYGSATITSDIPIVLGALNVILPAGKLIPIPVNQGKFD